MSVIVYEDTDGELFGFCSRTCLDFWRHLAEDRDAFHQRPEVEPESGVGCWWCGTDLMNQEGIEWVVGGPDKWSG